MTESPYKPPAITISGEDEYSIPFILEALAAGAQNTAVSSMIPLSYRVTEIKVYFPDDAINNVRVYWLASNNGQGSTTTIPDGTNLIASFSGTTFLIGHADVITLRCSLAIESAKSFIKMHVLNNNAYAITIMGIIALRKR
jgi:hypothetical protein